MRAAVLAPERPTGKANLSAASTASLVLKERLAIRQVKEQAFSFVKFFNFCLFFFGTSDSLHCERCPPEFWPNVEQTICMARQLDFLSFNETLGITLTTVAASGVTVTAAVFVVFLHYRHTPVVRNWSDVMIETKN